VFLKSNLILVLNSSSDLPTFLSEEKLPDDEEDEEEDDDRRGPHGDGDDEVRG
jgi:hypothetical protein